MSTLLGLMNGDDITGPEVTRVSNKDLSVHLREYAGFYATELQARTRMKFPQDMDLGHWDFLISRIDSKGTAPGDKAARQALVDDIAGVLFLAERKSEDYETVEELQAHILAR